MTPTIPLHARVLGNSDAPNLIVLHGLLGTSDNWQTLGKAYSATHCVHLIDQRNHGRSPHHDEHTYEAMAFDLQQYFEENKLHTASVLGHSMGGKTALMFAHLFPARIEKLIVADIASHSYLPHHQAIFDAVQSAPLQQAADRNAIQKHLQQQLNDPGVVAFLMKNARRRKEGGFQWRPNVNVLESTRRSCWRSSPRKQIPCPHWSSMEGNPIM
jgi:pimeloyl-ACP methyl ester carboxylesterase